jgi:predicted DNA-binding transcriptional regulator AlpA
MNVNEEIQFLEVPEIAEWLHVSVKTIYNLIYDHKKGKKGISNEFYLKVGKKVLFVKSKVDAAVHAGTFIS